MTAGLIIRTIWPHLASTGKIMCIIRYVNVGLSGRSWKMRRCRWQGETGAAGRGRFGSSTLKHLTFGVWGEHCLELINNSPTMTTCNDSFCYGLVNPQIQLCSIRPSAAHLFFSVFPLAFVKCRALGKLWPHESGVCAWDSSLALGEGKRQEWAHRKRGFCHGSSVLPGLCADPAECTFLRAFTFPGMGKCHSFSCWVNVACFCQRNYKPLSLPTSAPAILSQPEVRRRRGYGNSLRTQLLLRGVASLCPHHASCHSSLVRCQLS